MPAYQLLSSKSLILALLFAVGIMFIFPPIMIVATAIELVIMAISTPADGDEIF